MEDNELMKHAVRLVKDTGDTHLLFPCAELRIFNDMGLTEHKFQVLAKTDVVCCSMLNGTGANVMTHLGMALTLGASLRQKLRPDLAKYNLNFHIVLFVTEEALEKQEFQAASYFWSMKVVDLPIVAQARLEGVSEHLKDTVAAEHIFLKSEAFGIDAKISIISDLDMMILNADELAKSIRKFLPGGSMEPALKELGTAAMQRLQSKITNNDPQMKNPVQRHKLTRARQLLLGCHPAQPRIPNTVLLFNGVRLRIGWRHIE